MFTDWTQRITANHEAEMKKRAVVARFPSFPIHSRMTARGPRQTIPIPTSLRARSA